MVQKQTTQIDQGVAMSKKKKELLINSTFEPTRLAQNHLVDTYELVIPRIKHRIKTTKNTIEITHEHFNKRIGKNKS